MKPLRQLFAALAAALVLTASAAAADINGTWKWTTQGRNGAIESTGTFALKDGVLSGTVTGRMGEAPIGDASYQDGVVRFTVTREFNGNKIVIKYDGKVEGDAITGKIERPGFNEQDSNVILDWKAARVK